VETGQANSVGVIRELCVEPVGLQLIIWNSVVVENQCTTHCMHSMMMTISCISHTDTDTPSKSASKQSTHSFIHPSQSPYMNCLLRAESEAVGRSHRLVPQCSTGRDECLSLHIRPPSPQTLPPPRPLPSPPLTPHPSLPPFRAQTRPLHPLPLQQAAPPVPSNRNCTFPGE
jgi:hypothetical protein